MNSRFCLFFAAVFGLLSLLVGTFSGHGIEGEQGARLDTVVRYLQVYAAVLVGLSAMDWRSDYLNMGAALLAAGAGWFCLCLLLSTSVAFSLLAYLAPIGGIAMMAGWAMVGLSVMPKIIETWPETRLKNNRVVDFFLSFFLDFIIFFTLVFFFSSSQRIFLLFITRILPMLRRLQAQCVSPVLSVFVYMV